MIRPSISAQRCLISCLVFLLAACHRKTSLFEVIDPASSGIHFNNAITENDSLNPADNINMYNGGGVGVGDFNGDGLPDLYFTGSLVSNKLYLNKGDFKFDDITDAAGVNGAGRWCKGVAVVDINNDGLPDIYVCTSMSNDVSKRRNILYINQGNDAKGIPHFKDMAAEYGLDDTTHSTMAYFFDYDNDGDLDMYLVVNQGVRTDNPVSFRKIITDGSHPSTGRLYRNDYSKTLGHPVFTNVSKEAGILTEGYGHAASIIDINRDGWKDIYVSNDFLSEDILYINNGDGTFTNRNKEYFKHTSEAAMGQDAADINNDGLIDLVELDMSPEDNFRRKTMLGASNYQIYQLSDQFNYQYQYIRNMLQLNQGPRKNGLDSVGAPIFSDIGFFAGIAETDWSWTPLAVDFDNDGWRDIVITNGYPKDVTDRDFMTFRDRSANFISKMDLLKQIREVKINSYAFHNNGDLSFSNVSNQWGFTDPGFANGTVYVDLDNDGDLDLVTNKINDEAGIYKNMSREQKEKSNHFFDIKYTGDSLNKDGTGAWANLYYDHGKSQVDEHSPYRGYLSTVTNRTHFGLGAVSAIDSLVITWPDGNKQLIKNPGVDQIFTAAYAQSQKMIAAPRQLTDSSSLFIDITRQAGIEYIQQERDYIDFNVQKMLPHKFSEYGPAMAAGDIDGNGTDDMIVGGSAFHSAQIFLQQANGSFRQQALLGEDSIRKMSDDLGVLLFDADGDGDLDLYIASGGYESAVNSSNYTDRLYLNDGKGHFTLQPAALPVNFTSKFCVRAADYDHDGDPDLFISGRVMPGNYPKPVTSYIYRNDSKNGVVKFTDVTATVAPGLLDIGMVCDAQWTDFNNDGWPDLVLAGEWMPLTLLQNDKGILKNISANTGIGQKTGWWNSIAAGDFDNDGDIDYIVGNLGANSYYQASDAYPVRVYAKDFDSNGIYDMIPSQYLKDPEGKMEEYPSEGRDELLKQITVMRKKFPDYKSFALATMNDVLSDKERQGALILQANELRSCFIRNDGAGKFSLHPLPAPAQLSVINGMATEDFDGDGNLDLVMNTNDYGTEVLTGRYDAMNGLLLKGDGKGNFVPMSIVKSGIFVPGDGKALVTLKGAQGRYLLAAAQNRGALKLFQLRKDARLMPENKKAAAYIYTLRDGRKRRAERYDGSSFLSQSVPYLKIDSVIAKIEEVDANGHTTIVFQQ